MPLGLPLVACSGDNGDSGTGGESVERQTPIAAVEIPPRDLSRQISLSATVEPRTRNRLASAWTVAWKPLLWRKVIG